jgi:arylsulfatase A-like enzyme
MRSLRRVVRLCAALYIVLAVVVYFSFLRPPKPGYVCDIKFKSKGNRLSLLLITVDALRADYVSSNGYPQKITPTIDGLASAGLNFTKAITPIPKTTQSLASLLTGRYPYKTGVRNLWNALPQNIITLTEVLKNIKYQTAAVVSNHNLIPDRNLAKAFDHYDFESDRRDAMETTRSVLRHFDRIDRRSPFFIWVHYIDPHVPYYPPEKIIEELDPDYQGRYKKNFGDSKLKIGGWAYPQDIGKEGAVFRNKLGETVNEHIRKLYAAEVIYTDRAIHELLAQVGRRVGDQLIVILTADHGESLGEHDYYYEHGDYLYNAQLRVPLIFRLPRTHKLYSERTVSDWVSLIDVLPTTLDLLEIEVSSEHLRRIDGVSLLPYWEGRKLTPRPLFSESDDSFFPEYIKRRVRHDIPGRFRSVIFEGWKLIWTPFQEPGMLYELYDLESDPEEMRNLYELERARAEGLEKHLQQWMSQQIEPADETPPTQKDLEILKSLGYIK